MPRQVHLFDRPTRFVAGTVGQPGDRTFYLQASDDSGRTVSVALEKNQVQILADRMHELLDEVAGRANTVIPPDADVDDLEPLTAPIDEEFRVAAMGLEKIHFFWYVKKISGLALIGYFAGAAIYLVQSGLLA